MHHTSKPKFHLPRRTVQIGTLLLMILIPTVGLFRIDLATATFHIAGHPVLWSNFAFTIGLAIAAITFFVLTYTTIGPVWCGWSCPQNFLVEWANNLTHRFLGKRADVRIDGKGMVVAASKNKLANWLMLGSIILAASMALALIPLLYFLPPAEVLGFILLRANNQATSFFTFPYFFIALLIFIDVAFLRYFFCDYACAYRFGNILFKNRDALHIGYDATRSADCAKCNFCSVSCLTGIQPTDIKQQDRCIGCGECVDACDQLHEKTGTQGLLRFKAGMTGGASAWKQKLKAIASRRLNWMLGLFFLLGCAMMAWGFVTQPPLIQQPSPEVLQKQQHIERVCNEQCASYIDSCKGHDIAGCYRASACRCACNLQQDPGSPDRGTWQQCVKRFNEFADSLNRKSQDQKH